MSINTWKLRLPCVYVIQNVFARALTYGKFNIVSIVPRLVFDLFHSVDRNLADRSIYFRESNLVKIGTDSNLLYGYSVLIWQLKA